MGRETNNSNIDGGQAFEVTKRKGKKEKISSRNLQTTKRRERGEKVETGGKS